MNDRWSVASWTRPELSSVAEYLQRFEAHDEWPSANEIDALLREQLGSLRLEAQIKSRRRRAPLDFDSLYLVRIVRHQRLPTRERNWHDFLNALVWAAFPLSKRALVARQMGILERTVAPDAAKLPVRSREEDALAMVDEGAMILLFEPDKLDGARAAHRQGDIDWLRRHHRDVSVFGHAVMEHVVRGQHSVRCFSITLAAGEPDQRLSAWIRETRELDAPSPWRGLSLDAFFPAAPNSVPR